MLTKMKVRKKDGTIQEWNSDKITAAVSKSAERINVIFNDQQINSIIGYVEHEVDRIAAESGTTLLPQSESGDCSTSHRHRPCWQ